MDSGSMIPLLFYMMDGIKEYKTNSKQNILHFLCFLLFLGSWVVFV